MSTKGLATGVLVAFLVAGEAAPWFCWPIVVTSAMSRCTRTANALDTRAFNSSQIHREVNIQRPGEGTVCRTGGTVRLRRLSWPAQAGDGSSAGVGSFSRLAARA